MVADIDEVAASDAVDELTDEGSTAVAVRCDVTDDDSVVAAIRAGVDHLGALDVLVVASGGDGLATDPDSPDDAHWFAMLDLNLVGPARCTRAALPHLRASRLGASVVFIGSVNGLVAVRSEPYSAAKAGLQNLTINLAARYAAEGVRVNLVAPATTRTRVWEGQPRELQSLSSRYPLGRVGEPEDIAAAVAFLASDDAAWITGVTLPVDGGVLAAGPFRS